MKEEGEKYGNEVWRHENGMKLRIRKRNREWNKKRRDQTREGVEKRKRDNV